jgi:hypothetical protein
MQRGELKSNCEKHRERFLHIFNSVLWFCLRSVKKYWAFCRPVSWYTYLAVKAWSFLLSVSLTHRARCTVLSPTFIQTLPSNFPTLTHTLLTLPPPHLPFPLLISLLSSVWLTHNILFFMLFYILKKIVLSILSLDRSLYVNKYLLLSDCA